jgi:hypothetical protein
MAKLLRHSDDQGARRVDVDGRRSVFKVAKADEPSGATTAALGRHSAGPKDAPPITFMFLETDEAAFVEAAVSRLISADE